MLGAIASVLLAGASVSRTVSPESEQTDFFKVRVAADVGFPDGVAVGASVAPLPHLRVSIAGLTNVMGFGIRGGLSVVPFARAMIHPLLTVELGRYFSGDPRKLFPNGPERFTYDFVDASVGAELTLWRFSLFVAGGLAPWWTSIPLPEITFAGMTMGKLLPCAKLGLQVRLN